MGDIGKRFPFDAYPKGWFQVAYSSEVDAGQVVCLLLTEFRAWARQSYEEAHP
jgi:hypothetical protein